MRTLANALLGASVLAVTALTVWQISREETVMITAEKVDRVLIRVPFSPQAPFGAWDPLHNEACEEASLILVHHYLEGTEISYTRMEEEILAMVAFEEESGYAIDVTVGELGEIARRLYGYRPTVITDVSVSRIKQELLDGNPVIVPLAGRDLENPYYSGEGPWYHMLVITGYDRTHFITNDVGTRRGLSYRYRFDVLVNAIHDWTGVREDIRQGKKRVLVLQK